MDSEQEYIAECWAFLEKPKPGRRIADGARSVQDLFSVLMLNSPQSQSFREQEVFLRWVEVVGEAIAQYVHIVDVKEGEILLRTEQSVWKTEFHFRKGTLLKRCDELFGKGLIRNFRFI